MSFGDLLSFYLLKFAKLLTRNSGNLERAYEKAARLGFVWTFLIRSINCLGIDEIIYAPSKSTLIPVPLFISTSEKIVKDTFKPTKGDVVVDVGTYIGRYTLIASKRVGVTGKVIGVEANPNNFKILKYNVQASRATNVLISCVAVSNHDDTIRLFLGESGGWTSIFRSSSGGWNSTFPLTDKYIDVPCTTLDFLLKKFGVAKVDWMKIDVEGAEVDVLEGASKILQNSDNLKVIIETHPVADKKRVVDLLTSYGYEVKSLERSGSFRHFFASKNKNDVKNFYPV